MKVVYDISILSHGFRSDLARTGIHRVVDRTLKGLESQQDISLELSAAESWENYYWADRFLQQEDVSHRDALIPRGPLARALYHAQDVFYGVNAQAQQASGGRASVRIARRLTGAVTSRTSALPRHSVTGRDIFHSGCYALPQTTKNVRGLRRFVTVFDLIPVLFPHLFADGVSVVIRDVFESMLRSIGPEDYVLAISEATRNDLCSYLSIDPSHVFVSPLAAAPDLFYPVTNGAMLEAVRARYGISRGAKYFLSVNTLEPRKNMEHALRCFAAVLQESKIDDLYFVLVGTRGWDFEHILATIAHANISADRVILAGYVPDADLAPLYSGALAFVYPSHYEGFGLPPLEAMQCGTPVITSNTSAMPEVVGNAGIMVSPTDEDALSHAMFDLYTQPSLRADMARQSLAQARRFSWTRYTKDVVASYRTVLGG